MRGCPWKRSPRSPASRWRPPRAGCAMRAPSSGNRSPVRGRPMSDPDAMPDPIDKAYAQAEAMLDDEAARATRRARVLAAVAAEPAAAPASPPSTRGAAWRRGGWLAAACVAGLSLLVVLQFEPPVPLQPPAAPPAPPVAAPEIPAPPPPAASRPTPTPEAAPRSRAV